VNAPITIPRDLQAAFGAAWSTVVDAVGNDTSDFPAWCRQVAAARRALAEVYATASDALPTHDLIWHALTDAQDAQRDRANHLDGIADRREQKGRTSR
jgi:hypothetical protein